MWSRPAAGDPGATRYARNLASGLAFDAVVALPCFQTDGSAGDTDKRQPDQSPVLFLTGPAWG